MKASTAKHAQKK